MSKPKKQIVLSGSGLLYPIHAGALDRLTEDYEIEAITGISGGSMIAALYASGYDTREVKRIVLENLPGTNPDLIDWSWRPWRHWGFLKGNGFLKTFERYMPETMGETVIPLKVGTVNIDRQCFKIWSTEETPCASLPKAVRASIAFPIAIAPIMIEGERYVDGGVGASFPLDIYGTGEDVIGIKIMTLGEENPKKPHSVFTYAKSVLDTMRRSIDREHIEDALFARFLRVKTKASSLNIKMSQDEAEALYQEGYDQMDTWLRSLD